MVSVKWNHIESLIKDNEIDAVAELCRQMPEEEYDIITNRLIDELRSVENKNCRGTFVYALENLQCEAVIKDLFPILFDGNYEVRWSMCMLLSEKVEYMNDADRLGCMRTLREEKEKLLEELELLEDVEEILKSIRTDNRMKNAKNSDGKSRR